MKAAAHRPADAKNPMIRRGPALAPLVAALFAAVGAAAQEPIAVVAPALYETDHLGIYTAQVSWRFVHNEGNRTWVCREEGSAIFLGGNRFLTAAHVVDQNPLTDDCAEFGTTDPVISFGPAELHARILTAAPWADEGGLIYPGGMDLAVLEVDGRMIPVELRSAAPLALCPSDLPAGADVRVATEYGVFAARTQPRTNDDFARIDLAARRGHSGGGIFDPGRRCLVGIVSNGGAEGTNYVPNEAVRRFEAERSLAQSVQN